MRFLKNISKSFSNKDSTGKNCIRVGLFGLFFKEWAKSRQVLHPDLHGPPDQQHSQSHFTYSDSGSFSVTLRTQTLTSLPGLRGSSNHAHLLGSFFLGLVSLQHCNGLLHLGEASYPVRPVLLAKASHSPPHLKEQAGLPSTGGILETRACAAAPSCQSLAAFL